MTGLDGIDSRRPAPEARAGAVEPRPERPVESGEPPLGIVLVEPEIPGNTGSIGRLAMATGCPLHLVGPLGFSTDDRQLRRAGMDYWRTLDVHRHESFATLVARLGAPRFHLLTARGARPYTQIPFRRGDLIVFGRESVGLPGDLLAAHADACYHIPMWNAARSHNLANAVSIVLYEGLRQLRCF